jgi:hypothetical protein
MAGPITTRGSSGEAVSSTDLFAEVMRRHTFGCQLATAADAPPVFRAANAGRRESRGCDQTAIELGIIAAVRATAYL